MSLKAMLVVMSESQSALGARLVLIAIADYAHDDGKNAFPSIATIAKKANLSYRSVQRGIATLIESGELRSEARKGNDGGQTSNTYTIVLPGFGGDVPAVLPHANMTPPPRQYDAPPLPVASPDPLVDPTSLSKKENVIGDSDESPQPTPLKKPKTSGARKLPDDWQPKAETKEKIIQQYPDVDHKAETTKFRGNHIAKGSRMANWDQALLNWFRNGKEWGTLTPAKRRSESAD